VRCRGVQVRYASPTNAGIPYCFYVLLRSQTNAFFYREAPTIEDLFSTTIRNDFKLFGHYDSNYFDLQQGRVELASVLTESADASRNVSFQVDSWFTINASFIYNFGFIDCLPGSIRFDGDVLESVTNAFNGTVSGALNRLPTGRVGSINFDVARQAHRSRWLIEYSYESTDKIPEGLPSYLKASVVRESGSQPQFTVRYLSLLLSRQQLPPQSFDHQKFFQEGVFEVAYTKNKGSFRDPVTGTFHPLVATGRRPFYTVLVILIGVFLIPGIFGRVFWLRNQQKHQ
jgi:hypothetical protein